jgi:hypothetical protein
MASNLCQIHVRIFNTNVCIFNINVRIFNVNVRIFTTLFAFSINLKTKIRSYKSILDCEINMNPIPNELGYARTTLLQLAESLNTLQRNAQHRGKLFDVDVIQ